jgi:hypothetical protein
MSTADINSSVTSPALRSTNHRGFGVALTGAN